MRKGILALIGMIITLVFIIIALIGPWYSASGKVDDEEGYSNYSLTGLDSKEPGEDAEFKSYADIKEDLSDDAKEKYGIFDTTMYITIGTLIVCILALIGILGISFNFGKPGMMKMLGGIFGILTFILALVAIFYFMSLPSEFEMKDSKGDDIGFWASDEIDYMGSKATVNYGPGYAWYLMLLAAIISLIMSIMLFLNKGTPIVSPPKK